MALFVRGLSTFPLISAFMWLGMLLAMFITWEVQGSPHLASMLPGQHIAYISDVGAGGLKPLFIAGSCVTTLFLDLSFASERLLRHNGRLVKNYGTSEKILSGFAIAFAVAGTCGLILLSIFDTLRHHSLHDGFLLLFIGGYVISAIFVCAEYQRLGIHYRQHRILRISFWIKLTFIILEIVLAIVFGANSYKGNRDVAAIFEWIVALVFTFWVLSFLVDLWPALREGKHHQEIRPAAEVETGYENGTKHHPNNHTNGHIPLQERNGNVIGVSTYNDVAYDQFNGTVARPAPSTAPNF